MKLHRILFSWLLLTGCGFAAEAPKKPNIIFILTDDLGFGDVGVFFQNERKQRGDQAEPWHMTPKLDTMAKEGIQLRDYYCPAPVCAPSRASLLLGVHQGHANVRDNQFDKALENNHTLATVLNGAGYATGAIGKWGLQGGPAERSKAAETASPADWPGYPTKRGFDFYFGYVRHGDGHWHYPKEDGRQIWENETLLSDDFTCCYTTDLFTARAKKWIVDQHTAKPDQPFFLYLAYDTPHAKLQLPPGEFPAGNGAKGGVQWTGKSGAMINTSGGSVDSYTHPDYASALWDHDRNPATPDQPWPDVYKRFATDVRRIDDCVGDLLGLLRDLKIDDNTLVVFTSDNGPSQESYLKESYEANFFNSFGPFDGIKRDCWDGGIRVGAIVRWPGTIPADRVSTEPCQAHDWMPTFAAVAGIAAPARTDGVSLVPTLVEKGKQSASRVYIEYSMPRKTPAYAEFAPAHQGRTRGQMQVLRQGEFVGVRYNVISHADPFEIYNIAADPQEKLNLAGEPKFAALQQELHDTVLQLRRPNETAPRPWDAEFVPAIGDVKSAPGLVCRIFEKAFPWVPKLDGMAATSQVVQSQINLSNAPKAGVFAASFSGLIEVPEDAEYTFELSTDTGGLLRIHQATVVDGDAQFQKSMPAKGSIRLKKGRHPVRLYYNHQGKDAPDISLRWSSPAIPVQAIPAAALFHIPSDT